MEEETWSSTLTHNILIYHMVSRTADVLISEEILMKNQKRIQKLLALIFGAHFDRRNISFSFFCFFRTTGSDYHARWPTKSWYLDGLFYHYVDDAPSGFLPEDRWPLLTEKRSRLRLHALYHDSNLKMPKLFITIYIKKIPTLFICLARSQPPISCTVYACFSNTT